ncbi:hypothetical protein ABH925_006354 [Streptacidiphilus sp. EB129]|jgi:hypothetical protein
MRTAPEPTRGSEGCQGPFPLASDRRIVLLTVFRKTRMREDAEVERAKQVTLPLLARLAKALQASLDIATDGDTSTVTFTAHAA